MFSYFIVMSLNIMKTCKQNIAKLVKMNFHNHRKSSPIKNAVGGFFFTVLSTQFVIF